MSLRSRGLVALVALAVALLAAVAARAEAVVRQDAAGRAINFDVLAPLVDVDWYAGILAAAAHGDEISRVTVRIVPPHEIAVRCGSNAAACFERRRGVSTITLPVGKSASLAAIVLHEYGHHLDASRAVNGVAELNGTPVWWAARGMAGLLAAGTVAFDYSLGWEHSIGEVFAEDYAYIHTGGWYSISWLAPPDATLKAAMLAELGVVVPPPAPPTPPAPAPAPPAAPDPPAAPPVTPPAAPPVQPEQPPVTATRAGVLAPRDRASIPFQLSGAEGRVVVTGVVSSVRRGRTAARLEVACGGAVVRSVALRRTTTLDVGGLGPGTCRAAVVSTSTSRQRYSLRLRISGS